MSRTKRNKCYNWAKMEPKWWRKMMKHQKRRVATRNGLHKLNYGATDADEVLFPLDKKPWVYFW